MLHQCAFSELFSSNYNKLKTGSGVQNIQMSDIISKSVHENYTMFLLRHVEKEENRLFTVWCEGEAQLCCF